MPAPKISLIVNTYERPDALAKVLDGLARQSEHPHEILIADDGSGEPTRASIEGRRMELNLRHIWQEHAGFRRTVILNKAFAAATGDYIVMLDGDCVPHRDFIRDHAELAEKNFWVQGRRCFVLEKWAGEFAAGAPIAFWCLHGRITGMAKAFRLPIPIVRRDQKFRGILGCNMGFWRDDLIAVNGFDEDFIGWGREDSDLGARMYHLGRTRKFVYGRAVIYHLNHQPLSREFVAAREESLAKTIALKKIRCEHGLDQRLKNL